VAHGGISLRAISLRSHPEPVPVLQGQKMKSVERKFDWRFRRISAMSALLAPSALAATSVRIEKTRSASETDSVPSAGVLAARNGNESGPRWHWLLMFTRQTWLTRGQ